MDTSPQRVQAHVSETPASAVPSPRRKDRAYYEFSRPDVLELVPRSAERVLDIGCGGGRLGGAVKRRQDATVVGVERNAEAAERARSHLDEVVVGDVGTDEIDFEDDSFDCVICADVLEHLRDPAGVLRKVRRWLRPEGSLVTSLPNVRNHTVVRSLLAGNWTYESAGLLDEDHVRFYTRREVEKLLYRAGFGVEEMRCVGGADFRRWQESGRPRLVEMGPFRLHAASEAEAEEFFAYQYLTRSVPASRPDYGLTSIVIVTHDQLAHTRTCLDSVRLRTDEPYELIVIDNGSTDGTVEHLRACDDVRLIENDTNRGFPAGANQGIEAAKGDNILLLNNDTVVTTGWLSRMLRVLHSDPTIGLVGPVSNNVSGEQRIPVSYDDLAQLDGFAWDWGQAHAGATTETDRLVGFCLLIRRQLVERIGLLDERFGLGNFDDDDYCLRALEAGFRAVVAREAFVHHVGSATYGGPGIDFRGLLEHNKKLFEEKWSLKKGNPDGQCKPRPRLSGCLIVRDNERTIGACLESLRPWVDELVVVDTGSTDRTPEICVELGARVFRWAWRDDFAAARNESIRHSRGEWIFWMDSDDTLPEECGRKLRDLAMDDHGENVLGYVVQVHCPGEAPGDVTVVDHIKLFRNRPDLRFEFRIHEQVLPSIRRAGGEVAWTDIHVVHSGADRSEEGKRRKLDRDLRLLELEHADRPHHPFVLFNLGMTCSEAGRLDEAREHLRHCIEVSLPAESHLRKAYAILAAVEMRSGEDAVAERTCEEGLGHYPGDPELLFRRAMVRHRQGRLAEAAEDYRTILDVPTERHFSSIDAGVTGYKARHNLAVVYEDMGRIEQAAGEWEAVLAERPDYAPAHTALRRLVESGRQRDDGSIPCAKTVTEHSIASES